jgi:hypothetical protein
MRKVLALMALGAYGIMPYSSTSLRAFRSQTGNGRGFPPTLFSCIFSFESSISELNCASCTSNRGTGCSNLPWNYATPFRLSGGDLSRFVASRANRIARKRAVFSRIASSSA